MTVLFCSSEALPFVSSGGLADVCYSLPRALKEKNIDCQIVIPLYECVSDKFKKDMKFLTSFYVPLAWRSLYCGAFELEYKGIKYYFLDNEYYFKRHELYGYFDEAERFAFFSRAVLEMLKNINLKPDIIHSNDWQTALVPAYYRCIYQNFDFYKNIKTVFTIHNIHYQGKFDKHVSEDIIGIDDKNLTVYDGCTNFMKAGIETADKVTTVSKTYSFEILNSWFSYGLHFTLQQNSHKLIGILNGIDPDFYNPETDNEIYENFSKKELNKKYINKEKLQERLNLKVDKNIPMVGMVTRLVDDKGIDLILNILDSLLKEEDFQFVILGSGEKNYEEFFDNLQKKYPGRMSSCHGFVPELSRKIYAASDIFLMPSKKEPCGLAQMIALRYGSIPIVRETGGLFDTVKDSGDKKGNGFTFKTYNAHDLKASIKRALKGYKNKTGWKTLTKRAMSCDNSWNKSSKEYVKLYESLM